MGMYGERLGRGVTREAARKYETSVTERARRGSWQGRGGAAARLAGQRLRQRGKPEIWHRRGAARFQFCRPAERGGGLGL